MSVTDEVSNLDTSNSTKDKQLLNIPLIFVTLEVFKFERSIFFILLQLLNIQDISIERDVSSFLMSISSQEDIFEKKYEVDIGLKWSLKVIFLTWVARLCHGTSSFDVYIVFSSI
jgi:hypothetical protein